MSDLYHVIYSGTFGFDDNKLIGESVEHLKQQIGNSFLRSVKETKVIYVDHPVDVEDVINTMDDRDIPCSEIFDDCSGLYLITSFVLKGIDRTDKDLLSLLEIIDSCKGK